jgi:hypothetical protein
MHTTIQKLNQKQVHPHDTRVKVIVVARPLLTPVEQKLCRCEHGVGYSLAERVANITSHLNRLVLFVKHLAMRILTKKYRISQQYTDWFQNFELMLVFKNVADIFIICCKAVPYVLPK